MKRKASKRYLDFNFVFMDIICTCSVKALWVKSIIWVRNVGEKYEIMRYGISVGLMIIVKNYNYYYYTKMSTVKLNCFKFNLYIIEYIHTLPDSITFGISPVILS